MRSGHGKEMNEQKDFYNFFLSCKYFCTYLNIGKCNENNCRRKRGNSQE